MSARTRPGRAADVTLCSSFFVPPPACFATSTVYSRSRHAMLIGTNSTLLCSTFTFTATSSTAAEAAAATTAASVGFGFFSRAASFSSSSAVPVREDPTFRVMRTFFSARTAP